MNNTLKSAIPVAVVSAVLVALFFVGYSFWFKERVLSEFARTQKSEISSMQSAYAQELQKMADRVVARVDETNKTLDAAISPTPNELFVTNGETRVLEDEKIAALADAIMVRLSRSIPSPDEQARGYDEISDRVAQRLDPVLAEIARNGSLTRSDIEFYSNRITDILETTLREESVEKQQLNNNVLVATGVARDSLRVAQEMSALYLSTMKDEGVLSRILSLPVRVVQDVSKFNIVGSSDRREMEERLFVELSSLEERLTTIEGDMPHAEPPPETEDTAEEAEVEAPAESPKEQTAPVRSKPTPPGKSPN